MAELNNNLTKEVKSESVVVFEPECQPFIIIAGVLGCLLVMASLMMCFLSTRLLRLTKRYKREKLEGVVREHRMKFGSGFGQTAPGGPKYLPQRWRHFLPRFDALDEEDETRWTLSKSGFICTVEKRFCFEKATSPLNAQTHRENVRKVLSKSVDVFSINSCADTHGAQRCFLSQSGGMATIRYLMSSLTNRRYVCKVSSKLVQVYGKDVEMYGLNVQRCLMTMKSIRRSYKWIRIWCGAIFKFGATISFAYYKWPKFFSKPHNHSGARFQFLNS